MKLKNKKVLCVFAHPDDESFGPGGSIAVLAQENEVQLICVTDGNDPGKSENLTEIRKSELQQAAKILGIQKLYFLNYEDGSLRNDIYHSLADKIQKVADSFKPDILVTFELRGVSGHVDHMALSAITSFVFDRSTFVSELWYYCESEEFLTRFPTYFIFFPPGFKRNQVDKIIDVSSVWETKLTAMRAHYSQKDDAELIIKCMEGLPQEEYFLVRKKK